jgi:chemotaxis protein CheD
MKIIVGISDMKVSNKPGDVIITYSLGSCIGLVVWDPKVKVGGLLHYMLPESKLDKERAKKKPYMFGDTGIPNLFRATYELGAAKNRLIVKAVGGSQLLDSSGVFNIGKRNYAIMQKLFEKNNISIAKEDIGGTVNRTISLDVKTGRVVLKVSGKGEFEI